MTIPKLTFSEDASEGTGWVRAFQGLTDLYCYVYTDGVEDPRVEGGWAFQYDGELDHVTDDGITVFVESIQEERFVPWRNVTEVKLA